MNKSDNAAVENNHLNNLGVRLARSPFWQQVGWKLQAATDDSARVCLPYNEANTTAETALHGGVIAATLDVAGSLAAWSGISPEHKIGLTLACDVNYIVNILTTNAKPVA